MSIDSGAYEVSIQYDSYVAENRMDISNARVSLTSIVNIKCENITLSDAHTYESGKLWVPMFSECNDLRLNIAYNGSGKLKIHGINIRDILRYRFIRILKLILLFSAFDIFTVLFYTNINIKLKKEWVILFGIVVISSLPFFSSKLYKGDDIWFHLKRIATLAQEMQNGNFIIKMGTSLDNEYSYLTPIYYCDFFLYPVAFLYYMAVPLRMCYQIYVIFINTLTTIITYFSIGKFSRNTLIRLAGTALYVLSVYRLVNLNRRAAVGEYTAMTFLPLIVVGVYLIYNSKKPRINEWIYLALGMFGIILSHVLTCEIVVVNLIILCIVLLKRTLKKERIMAFIKAAIMCLVLTIWYLFPFIDYFVSQETIVQAGDLRLLDNSSQEIIDIFQLFAPGNEGWKYSVFMEIYDNCCINVCVCFSYLVRLSEL